MLSRQMNLRQFAIIAALVGGVLQIVVGAGVFLLPIVGTCGSAGCTYTSLLTYLRIDMPFAGYALVVLELALAVVPGAVVVMAVRRGDSGLVQMRCWIGGVCSLVVAYMSWLFGLYFLPGGVLMLAAGVMLRFGKVDHTTHEIE